MKTYFWWADSPKFVFPVGTPKINSPEIELTNLKLRATPKMSFTVLKKHLKWTKALSTDLRFLTVWCFMKFDEEYDEHHLNSEGWWNSLVYLQSRWYLTALNKQNFSILMFYNATLSKIGINHFQPGNTVVIYFLTMTSCFLIIHLYEREKWNHNIL